jgi:hypothetical protein
VIPPPRRKIAKRQFELRKRLWPEVGDEWLWSRHTHDGFTSMPRSIPLIMSMMDDMAKGHPVSTVYLDLWCRAYDESFVTLSKPREMAFHAGFDGQRAERTWRARLMILNELGFINVKEGPSGPASYALSYNPYKVVEWHYAKKRPGLRADKYHALLSARPILATRAWRCRNRRRWRYRRHRRRQHRGTGRPGISIWTDD